MAVWSVNNELERMWQEANMEWVRYHSGIYLVRLGKIMKISVREVYAPAKILIAHLQFQGKRITVWRNVITSDCKKFQISIESKSHRNPPLYFILNISLHNSSMWISAILICLLLKLLHKITADGLSLIIYPWLHI